MVSLFHRATIKKQTTHAAEASSETSSKSQNLTSLSRLPVTMLRYRHKTVINVKCNILTADDILLLASNHET